MSKFTVLKSQERWSRCVMVLLITFGTLKIIEQNIHFVVNHSNSLPFRFFIHFHKMTPKKGDYTLVDSPWFGGKLIKQIVGVMGDKITYNDKGELMVGQFVVGKTHQVSKKGDPLTPVSAQSIPEGKVFLFASHERSFDSRYQELGLVSEDSLQGTAYPIRWRYD